MINYSKYSDIRIITRCNNGQHWAKSRIGKVIFCKPHSEKYNRNNFDLHSIWYENDEGFGNINGGDLHSKWTKPYPIKLISILYGA